MRAIFFGDKHLGTIIKVPEKGQFLANVARGASYAKGQLGLKGTEQCQALGPLSWALWPLLDGLRHSQRAY